MYGAQTWAHFFQWQAMFENDVEMYGAQTSKTDQSRSIAFENDVEMYGAQTAPFPFQMCMCV